MKNSAWLYTILVLSALVMPLLPNAIQAMSGHSTDVAIRAYSACDPVHQPWNCQGS